MLACLPGSVCSGQETCLWPVAEEQIEVGNRERLSLIPSGTDCSIASGRRANRGERAPPDAAVGVWRSLPPETCDVNFPS